MGERERKRVRREGEGREGEEEIGKRGEMGKKRGLKRERWRGRDRQND